MPIDVSPMYLKLMPAASARSRTADAVAPGTARRVDAERVEVEIVQLPIAHGAEGVLDDAGSVWTRVAMAARPCGPW